MRKPGFLLLALIALGASLAGAQNNGNPSGSPTPAPPLTVDGTWQSFSWMGAPGALNLEGAFTFSGPAMLDVTDAFSDGDQFDVLDGGVSIGMTSVPTNSGTVELNADNAFADARWSSGSFPLGAGPHSITIETIAVPSVLAVVPDGIAYLRATPTMAAPATPPWALTLLTLAAVASGYLFLRRRTAE